MSKLGKVLDAVGKAAKPLDAVFGGGKIGEDLGTAIGYALASKEQKKYYDRTENTKKAVLGSAGKAAISALPIPEIKALPYVARPLVNLALHAGTGYGYDVASSAEQDKVSFKPGLGTAISSVIPAAGLAKSVVKVAGGSALGGKVINTLIKPLQRDVQFGKNPGRAVAELGIKANSIDDLAKKIPEARNAVGQELGNLAVKVPSSVRINAGSALKAFDDTLKHAVQNNDQALYNRVNEARSAVVNIFKANGEGKIIPTGSRVLDNLSYKEGLDVKKLIGGLTKWTQNRTEDETANSALTKAYGILKGQLDEGANAADPATAAQIRKLNERYADLTSAESAVKHRATVLSRQNIVNLPGQLSVGAGLIAAPFTGGMSVLYGLGAAGLSKVLGSTAVKTRVASMLSKATPEELQFLEKTNPSAFSALRHLLPTNDLQSPISDVTTKVIAPSVINASTNQGNPPQDDMNPNANSADPQSIDGFIPDGFIPDNAPAGDSSTPEGFIPDGDAGPVSINIPSTSRLALANNNPGNLRFAGQEDATQGEKGFARFSSLQEGFNALVHQVKLDASRGHTLASFIAKFAPPTENDTKQYITQLATRMGISPSTPISHLDPIALAKEVARKESSANVA